MTKNLDDKLFFRTSAYKRLDRTTNNSKTWMLPVTVREKVGEK